MINAENYLASKKVKIPLSLKASLWEMDHALEKGESVSFAMLCSFEHEGETFMGIASVTTHRLLCASCVNGRSKRVSLPYTAALGIGDISGIGRKHVPVHCEGIAVSILQKSPALTEFTQALLAAIEAAPNQKNLDISAGATSKTTTNIAAESAAQTPKPQVNEDRTACCPKCGSTSLSANKKGFSFGKAVAGAFVTSNPVGLVGGALGANKLEITCLNCGHKFKPGKK